MYRIFLIFFVIYLWTSAPATLWFDTGELAVGAFLLGNGHPPGQPVYALAGKSACLLPAASLAFRMSLLSAFCSAVAIALLPSILERSARLIGHRGPHPIAKWIIAPSFGLALPIWLQAVRIELYSLHLLFFSVILYLCTGDLAKFTSPGPPRRESQAPTRFESHAPHPPQMARPPFALVCFVSGLAIAVHPLLALLAAPGILLLVGWPGLRNIFIGLVSGTLGFSAYLFGPLRDRAGAALRWSRLDSWEGWFAYVSGKDYQRSFTQLTPDQLFINLEQHMHLALSSLGLPIFLLASFGLLLMARRVRIFLAFLLLAGANISSTAMQSVFTPDNPDSLGYLAPTFYILAIGAGCGADWFIKRVHSWIVDGTSGSRALRLGVAATTIALAFVPAMRAWPRPNLSQDHSNADYGRLLISALPLHALYLSGSDSTTFASWYAQVIEGRRPDVASVGSYTLPNQGTLRSDFRLPESSGASLGAAELREEIIKVESDRREVLLTATDLPLRRRDHLRAAPTAFRVVSNDEQLPLDSQVDEVIGFWADRVNEFTKNQRYIHNRQARLAFPAHLEALGDHFLELGLLDTALSFYRAAEQWDPAPSRLVRLKRFRLETRLKELEAEPLRLQSEEVLQLGSTGPGQNRNGEILRQESENQEMLRRGNEDALQPPKVPLALRALARGRRIEARAILDQSAGQEIASPSRALASALLAWQEGRESQARDELKGLLQLAPTSIEAARALKHLWRLLPSDEAFSALRPLMETRPDPDLMVITARLLIEANKLDAAHGLLEAIIARFPEHASAYVARGRLHLRLDELAPASQDVQRALELDPTSPAASRLSLALYRRGVR